MSMLRNMKVSRKLACLVLVAIVGFVILLIIANQTLERNLLTEKNNVFPLSLNPLFLRLLTSTKLSQKKKLKNKQNYY